MKHFYTRLASCVAISSLALGTALDANAFVVGGLTYTPTSDTTCSLTTGDEFYEGDLVIPSTVTDSSTGKEYTVTAIGEFAFEYAALITSVEFPSTLETLGLKSFSACTGLTEVTLPASLRNFEHRVFEYCTKMENIFVEDGNQFYSSHDGILYNYVGTELVQVPQARAEVKIRPNVKRIGYGSFFGCENIKEVELPANVEKIDIGAFQDCIALKTINIPAKCKVINGWAFDHCASLMNVNFEDGCQELTSASFQYCTSLQTLRLPDSLKTIGESAFMGCSALENVYLGESISSIFDDAFSSCEWLEEITVAAETVPEIGEETFAEEVFENATLYVPDNAMADYADHEIWQKFKNMMPISSGVAESKASEKIIVEIADGQITTMTEGLIELYNLSGIRIAHGNGHLSATVAPGLYILRTTAGTSKIKI